MNSSHNAYQDALDYIYSFVDYSRTRQENLSPDNFDLDRMYKFMELLGSPQNSYPTIHIAGSKGKGSVGAFCASVIKAGGYKVGFYSSPHLKNFVERIQVNGDPIPQENLVSIVEEVRAAVSSIPELTAFEIMTGLAFLYFSKSEVDIAVIEVGLGGRLDATNIVTPMVSVITSLYLDHISILGDTVEKIAAEKGGIIKQGVPVVSAPQKRGPLDVLQKIAKKKESEFIDTEQIYTYQILSKSLEGQEFSLSSEKKPQTTQYRIPLLGNFQIVNAVTAYGVLEVIRSKGFSLDEEVIRNGFLDVNWPGRFEVLRKQPPVIVDSAHNPASMGKLRETIDDYFPGIPLVLVFGVSEDKQLDEMLEKILPRTTHFISTQADHPRAMNSEKLEEMARIYDCSTESIPDVTQALMRALTLAGNDQLVVVAGSIFVAGRGRNAWFDNEMAKGSFKEI